MNIRDQQKFLDTIWDWTPFNECFTPTKIRITDIDGAVERGGHFLFIETKLPAQDIPLGQRLMYDALAASPFIHVLVIWGKPNQPEAYQLWGYAMHKGGMDDVKDMVTRWFKHVNRLSDPPIMMYVREAQRQYAELQPPVWTKITTSGVELEKQLPDAA